MATYLHWNKNWLNSSCEIFSADRPVGSLKENTWSQSAEGTLNGKRYLFDTKGFFRQKTLLIDVEKNNTIGTITTITGKTHRM